MELLATPFLLENSAGPMASNLVVAAPTDQRSSSTVGPLLGIRSSTWRLLPLWPRAEFEGIPDVGARSTVIRSLGIAMEQELVGQRVLNDYAKLFSNLLVIYVPCSGPGGSVWLDYLRDLGT